MALLSYDSYPIILSYPQSEKKQSRHLALSKVFAGLSLLPLVALFREFTVAFAVSCHSDGGSAYADIELAAVRREQEEAHRTAVHYTIPTTKTVDM